MTKEEKIEILEKFRDELQLLRDGEEYADTRKNIGQMSAVVSKIMSQANTLKDITITHTTKSGKNVWKSDPIDNIFNAPFDADEKLWDAVLYMVDTTIGVLQNEEEFIHKEEKKENFWQIMHPEIVKVSKQRFDAELYADAVEAAFKEINSRVKEMYQQKSGNIKDGTELMYSAFAAKNPILQFAPTSHYSEFDVQEGYMHMFAGAMQGIRNPKAHANETIDKEDALRKLAFASMLRYKLDSVVK